MKLLDKIDVDKEKENDLEKIREANNSVSAKGDGPKKEKRGFCTKCVIY